MTAPLELTAGQQHALARIERWRSERSKPFFYLAGAAGTGKTTLAQHVAKAVSGTVLFAAYTGKAAHVLHNKGCAGASTVHSLIYLPASTSSCVRPDCAHPPCRPRCQFHREDYSKERTLNPASNLAAASLLILDECSMIDERMARDLLSFGVPILVLGDRFQLPPPEGKGYFTSCAPDFELTEITRQKAGSPVIRLATEMRNERCPSCGEYGDGCAVTTEIPADLTQFDMILVGNKDSRCHFNAAVRQQKRYAGDVPMVGENLVARKNKGAFRNGAIWRVVSVGAACDGFVELLVVNEDESSPRPVRAHAPLISFTADECAGLTGNPFNFGYALTCHQAQGSEWDSVLVVCETGRYPFKGDPWRWAYTAITRASKRVVFVVL